MTYNCISLQQYSIVEGTDTGKRRTTTALQIFEAGQYTGMKRKMWSAWKQVNTEQTALERRS